ncbi:shikimate kinase [Taibaiella koreensis]|uniref:shikimate kinase n=1 Tax=Taibaiella koreensis TaxID=1268548 RepID=UPI000E59A036|nr:shikimate kinase [Taibaiella koreensis]
MRIFLIGMPGSGKSYWSHQLSDLLHYEQADMDRVIETREGSSIPQLFTIGEQYFREKEREALQAILEEFSDKIVVATGGGAPCYKDNLQVMKTAGCVLYLETPTEALLANIEQQGLERPLLANGNRQELAEKLSQLYRQRKEIYEQAHGKIDTVTANLSTFAATLEHYLSDNNLSL